ncbi:hypothetical protein D3C80_2113620 [compost metagenome]
MTAVTTRRIKYDSIGSTRGPHGFDQVWSRPFESSLKECVRYSFELRCHNTTLKLIYIVDNGFIAEDTNLVGVHNYS